MVLQVYFGNGQSDKKTREWLVSHGIPYKEHRVKKDSLSKKELKLLLTYTENGLDDLIKRTVDSSRFDEMTLNQALDSLIKDPHPLRTPILYDGKKMELGFHEEEIRCFIPHEMRMLAKIV